MSLGFDENVGGDAVRPAKARESLAQIAANVDQNLARSAGDPEGFEPEGFTGAPRRQRSGDRRWWARTGQGDERRVSGGQLSALMGMLEEPASAIAVGDRTPRGLDRAIPVVDPALAASSDQLIQAIAAFRPDRGADIRNLTGTTLGDADGLTSAPMRWRRDRLKA